MGVEYCHYLIPRPNSFLPTPEQLASLVVSLVEDKWIAGSSSDALRKMAAINEAGGMGSDDWAHVKLGPRCAPVPGILTPLWFRDAVRNDLRLAFPVEHADRTDLRYPLLNDAGPPDDPYYEIQLHVCRDYVHHASELIDPVPTVCACGKQLAYDVDEDVFYAERIRHQCPQCSRPFDPSSFEVDVRDGWTGESSLIRGGTVYRFAVVIDCGKCIPERKRAPLRAHPALIDLCQRATGWKFYEVGDMY